MIFNPPWKNALLACLLGCCLSGAAGAAQQPLKIVATTTHLGTLLAALGGTSVEVYTLIPGGACPGHFDIDPGTARRIAAADIVITHAGETRFDDIVGNLGKKGLARVSARTGGNWMVPPVHDRAAQEMAEFLAARLPGEAVAIRERGRAYRATLKARVARVRAAAKRLRNLPVIAAAHQQALLEWLGLRVVAVYGRAEDLDARALAAAVQQARSAGAVLVIDNLQSGADTGVPLAKDLGIPHVAVTNFPLQDSYADALEANTRAVLDAMPPEAAAGQ